MRPPKSFKQFIALQGVNCSPLGVVCQPDIPSPKHLARESCGFVYVTDTLPQYTVGTGSLFYFKIKTKVLPASVLKKAIASELNRVTDGEQFLLSKHQLSELSDEVEINLLSQAFVAEKTLRVLFVQGVGVGHSTLIFVETTSPKEIDTVRNLLNVMVGSVSVDLTFGEDTLNTVCSSPHLIDGLTPDGSCVWAGMAKDDSRSVTLVNFELSSNMLEYWLNEGFILKKMDLKMSGSNGLTLNRSTTARFCLDHRSVFSKLSIPSESSHKARDVSVAEQANLVFMTEVYPDILRQLGHPFMVAIDG